MLPPTRDQTSRTRRQVAYVWQVPTALFAVALVPLLHTSGRDTDRAPHLVAGLVVIGVATVLAVLVPWERIGHHRRCVVPLLDLAGAALVYQSTHLVLPPSLLLVVLPVVWLSSEFDVPGLCLGSAGAFMVALTPTLTVLGPPDTLTAWINIALPPTSCFCLGFLALLVSRLLRRAGDEMVRHTQALDLRIATLHGVLEAVDAAITVHVADEPVLCNRQALELASLAGVGVGSPETSDRVFGADGVTPVAAADQPVSRAMRGDTWSGLLQWVRGPDEEVALLSSCHQMADHEGRRLGTVLVGFDATAIVESVRVREEFLTTVSHELRTPLTSVIGYLELLDDEVRCSADVGDQARLVSIVQRNADVLLGRINQLLEAAPDGGSDLDPRPVDLSVLTDAALDKHRVLAGRRAITLQAQVRGELVSVVDAVAYEQVVDNLVTNAIKYTEERGTVRVVLDSGVEAVDGDEKVPVVVLEVVDTGVGMSPAECHRAFDRFYRAPAANARAIPGLGIGLAITQRLVQQHGGAIALSSRPGVGTSVTVLLPVVGRTSSS